MSSIYVLLLLWNYCLHLGGWWPMNLHLVCGSPVSSKVPSSAFQSGWNQPFEKLSSQTAPCYCYVPSWSVTANVLRKEITQQRSFCQSEQFHLSLQWRFISCSFLCDWVLSLSSYFPHWADLVTADNVIYRIYLQLPKGWQRPLFFFINVKEVSRVICSFCYSQSRQKGNNDMQV